MIEKKNIDRLFQEKFKDFEAIPDEHIWENIEAELTKKKKRRVIPFWFRLAGAAAILILAGLIAYKLAFSGDDFKGKVVNGDKNPVENNLSPKGSPSDKSGNPSQPIVKPVQKKTQEAVASENLKDESSPEHTGSENGASTESGVSNSSSNKPAQIKNKRTGTIKSSSAVAGSENNPGKNPSGEATNRHNSHLVSKTGNAGRENQVATTENLNKKSDKKVTLDVENAPVVNKTGSKESENSVADAPKRDKKTEQSVTEMPSNNAVVQPENKNNASEKVKTPAEQQLADSKLSETKQESTNGDPSKDKKPLENLTGIANTDIKKDSAAIATAKPNALEELLNEKENNVTAKEQKVNRWQVTSNVAPIYFSSTSNGSPLDSRFEGNKKTYAPSVSYGVGAKYAITKKFFIKSGVNSVALEYNTSDVIFFQTENARRIKNVTPNIQGSLIQVDSKPQAGAATLGRTIRQFNGDLNQRINYVEIPMELSYQLVDRKFGIELIGGLSTLVLDKNEVSLVSSGMDMNIGEADNLNRLHFSTNVGVGFKYTFLKRFEANFEPMFKYQINTFTNDAGNFKPYFFGLYTGLSYKF
ncbi:MAG: hypothetical protein EOO48_00470 [Flavobacterium sp.]|nr:MAG: hypothetical protein EOO48_00470 [Flavobacterium sp.]